MSWRYEQATGHLSHDGVRHATGYSGFGEGKNNPEMQNVEGIGPLPRGWYTGEVIKGEDGRPCDYKGKKAPVIRLHADSGNEMFGRDGFLVHGESVRAPGAASHGCIIENHDERMKIAEAVEAGDNRFEVV